MYLPASTYRLQFNKEFNFNELRRVLPYLFSLCPGALYASPFFRAVPGSNHGYDVTSPLQINPEIGSSEEFYQISDTLSEKGIGWIQDIVPNHMAFHPDNDWLMDVMRFGEKSEYARFFDIDWNHPVYKNKVMVPVLGDSADALIKDGQLSTRVIDSEIWLIYGDFRLPVDPSTLEDFSDRFSDKNSLAAALNGTPEMLKSLLNRQHYVFTHWLETNRTINFRRFFAINGLISLNMEDHVVYNKYHELLFDLSAKNRIDGIRLDHVDGLKKPVEYFSRLRVDLGDQIYVIAEKILEYNEKFDPQWPIQGTSGYDFMSMVNGLFTGKGMNAITGFYREITGNTQDPEKIIYNAKRAFLKSHFSGDLDNIYRMIVESGIVKPDQEFTSEDIKAALGEWLVCCPVYKLYSDALPLANVDRTRVESIFRQVEKNSPQLKKVLSSLKKIFDFDNPEHTAVFLRLMQFTGPLMAKGIEDTAMYTWVPNIARNEVGDSIAAPELSIVEFHKRMIERRETIPATINATSTHDTKRGEDSRARINVITDMPDEWINFYRDWSAILQKYPDMDGKTAPDENERYFICQVIISSLPMNGKPDADYLLRLNEYTRKSLREANINTNWISPDEAYENKVLNFCDKVLTDNILLKPILDFLERIRDFGIINTLVQVVLKCTCPGIPDFYQGTELWDFSFVDPDNRRQVDYSVRKNMLDQLKLDFTNNPTCFLNLLYHNRFTGSIKLWFVHRLMNERFEDPELWVYADYIPLKVSGSDDDNIIAYLRVHGQKYYAVIIALHLATIQSPENIGNCIIHLPLQAPRIWRSLWDGRVIESSSHQISTREWYKNIPLVLKGLTE